MSIGGGGSKRGEIQSDINVTPMADVMLVLLIIFMVVTPMLQKGIGVDLAKTLNATDMNDADKDDAVLLAVTRDGKFYLAKERVEIEDLGTKVADMVRTRLDKTVYVKSDERAKYGDVVRVVNTVRDEGVDRVGLVTERIDDKLRK